ncbi:MAG: 50S ribosomal protein L35 [Bdellovibrionales bacterium]|jgi:large subunit ribosomal protein L35|nr:50S ribosomal protein L35 [Bdellovibrionales bacterium]MBT3525015.1 50S ribosomal protein L35 [Bdellovibrionales bacterium]MBT7765886.1 50S ribosomal protein L35 [Bdellovibrionales bacterium]
MPKMKTRRAAAKRFSATGSGKIRRRRANLRHILEKKDHKRKKRAGQAAFVSAAQVGPVKKMLPYL